MPRGKMQKSAATLIFYITATKSCAEKSEFYKKEHMIKESAKLKSLVDQLINPNPENELSAESFTDTIAAECHRLKYAVYEIFKSEPNPEVAAWDVNNFHSNLIKLTDRVTEKLDGDEQPLAYTLYCLTDILNFNETCFMGIISDKQEVPQFYILKMKEMLHTHWRAVEEGLGRKRIAPWTIREICSGLRSMVKRSYPAINYLDYHYFQVFFSELTLFASDQRRKNWEQRMLYFLNHFNFNHMGFFNHWTSFFLKKLKTIALVKEKLRMINNTKYLLSHTSVIKDIAYDRYSASLHVHLLLFLEEQKELILSRSTMEPPEPVKLQTQLSADELSVEFYYKYRQKLFNYESKKEAARDFAAVHSSKQTQDISAHSIGRFDKKRLFPAALKYHRIILAIDKEIIRDFKLGGKESEV